jgi:hypothetical protein
MLGLLLCSCLASPWLGASPPPALEQAPREGPVEGPVSVEEQAQPPAQRRRKLNKGQRMLIGAGVAYGVGSTIQWATVGGTGLLSGERPGGSSGVVLGLTLGGIAMTEGLALGAVSGGELARHSHGHDDRAEPMLAGGAVLTGLGAGAMIGTMMFWPSIRARCPIEVGCGLGALQLGGAAVSVGAGMMSYGHRLRRRDPEHRRLSKKAKTPLVAGGVALGTSWVLSATLGMLMWQEEPEDPGARRLRDRMLVPVVGPWIHAAGPDASVLMAMFTGGLGAVQIGGAIAMIVGGARVGIERRRHREDRRAELMVLPSVDGIRVVGRF